LRRNDVGDGMITKILIGAAIALAAYVGGTATADGEPNPIGTDPSPFSALSCSCQETNPAGSLEEEIDRGIRNGLSASLLGPPRSEVT
jgi:hypothetical protein